MTPPSLVDHTKAVVEEEELGDFYRTIRSGVHTKLAHVREHDHGQQKMAHKVVRHAKTVTVQNNVHEAIKVEHELERVHEHRTLLSSFTLWK